MTYEQLDKNTVDAANQLKNTELVRFFNPSGKGKRIMFVGNSITLHGYRPKLGWYLECGMAASAEEKDYVHLTMSQVQERQNSFAPPAFGTIPVIPPLPGLPKAWMPR